MKIITATLGCKVNQYETEMIKEKFRERGYDLSSEMEDADIIIINTCSVTALAERKARQLIRSMKKKSPDSILVVTGCYPQTNLKDLKNIEEIDILTGTNYKSCIAEMVEEFIHSANKAEAALKKPAISKIDSFEELKMAEYEETGCIASLESRTRGNIKIQEGCDRYCSYCIIPYARGNVRSRSLEESLQEAKLLVRKGCKEIVLTGINTALYGTQEGGIERILSELEDMEGEFRIRLSSLEPTVINAEYVKKLLKYKRLCPHLHLSVQSGSDRIISSMNRKYSIENYLNIVNELRMFRKDYGISTDIIVGFPDETESDFKKSLELIEKAGFCKVHGFRYSKRKGTRAAEMSKQVAPEVKNRRVKELIELADNVSRRFFENCIGRYYTVLIEEFIEGSGEWTGYTENYIKVYLNAKDSMYSSESMINQFVQVRLTNVYKDGMKGKLLSTPCVIK